MQLARAPCDINHKKYVSYIKIRIENVVLVRYTYNLSNPKGNKMAKWNNYPFTVGGVNFNSRVNMESSIGKQVARMGDKMFTLANTQAVNALLGDVSTMSLDTLKSELVRLNAGGSEAFIELA